MHWRLCLAALFAALTVDSGEAGQVVRAGILDNFPPHFVIEKESGDPAGFAIDIMAGIARAADLDVQYRRYASWADLIAAIRENEIDVAPLLPVNAETIGFVNLTSVVYTAPMSVFVRVDNDDISANADMRGRRVSVVAGDLGEAIMRSYRGELSIVHKSVDDALYAVISRTSHALLFQDEVLLHHARPLGLATLIKRLKPPLHYVRFAVAVNKSNSALFAALQPVVDAYVGSDSYLRSRTSWIGNPAPPFDLRRILIFVGVLVAVSVASIGLWRHLSVLRLNKALARSIAERKVAEARFKDHAEAASDWFFELDALLRFTFLSPAFEKALGIAPQSLIGQKHWYGENQPDPGEREALDAYGDYVEGRRNWRDLVFTLRGADGEKRIISTSGKAIFDASGQFAGYRGIGRDVTKRIETEQTLQQAQKLETIGKLTGGIAHDFNNLLMVLTGNLEMLKRHVGADGPEREYLEISSEAVDLGSKLTQRLLAFSRRQSLDPERLDLNVLVRELLGLLRTSVGETIEIAVDLKPAIPRVVADKCQLQIALLNLALNARDAMANGGRITVATDEVEVDEALARAHVTANVGHYAVLRLSDTGIGIDPNNLRKVIEPFFTTKEVGEGTGLGLSTVYGFVKQSGGFFTIDSVLGQGTTASIYLACSSAEQEATGACATPLREPRGDADLILVVEDNPRVRQVTVIRLEDLGYRVVQAGNAQTALDLLRQHPDIGLLFTDVVMPGSSGIELARDAKLLRPGLKVLFTTGYSEELTGVEHMENWLAKPYKQKDLADKLRAMVEEFAETDCYERSQ